MRASRAVRAASLAAGLLAASLAVAGPAGAAGPQVGAGPGVGNGAFRAGAAVSDIDPRYPVYMGGYGGGPAGGTIARHIDPVNGRPEHFTVRAMAIAGAGGHVVELATVDTQGYFAGYQEGPYGLTDIRDAVAQFLAARGVPGASAADIVIASEHEHASPTLLGIWGPPAHQLPYLKQVAATLTGTLERAYERMRPATITWGQANVPWVADRVISEGNAFEGWPRDGSLGAIWARDARSGATIATFVSEPGYPNIVYGPGDLLGRHGKTAAVLSSDFPNYADAYISSRLGGIAIVTDGTLGNQTSALQTDNAPSPDLPATDGLRQTRGFDDIIHMGQLFAQITLSALARGHRLTQPIVGAAEQHITTPVYNPILIGIDKINTVPGGGSFLSTLSGGALYPTDRAFTPPYGDGNAQLSTWVTALRVGDLLLTSMPGEFFPSTHETWLKSISGPKGNFVLGAAQDFLGYEYPVYAYPFTLEGSDEGIFNPSLTLGDQVVQAGERDAQALGFHAQLTSSAEYTATENQYIRQFQPGVQFISFPQSGDLAADGRGFAPTLEGISQPPRDTTTQGVCLADTYTSCDFAPPPMGAFHWHFGDGTTAVTPPQTYARAYFSPFLHHRYCRPGTYTVSVTAADASGTSDSMSLPVTVYPPLSLHVSTNGRTLRATPRGGTGSLMYTVWRTGRRIAFGPVFRAPATARSVTVTAADGTGTVAAVHLRLAPGKVRIRTTQTTGVRAPPLTDRSPGRCR